MTIIQLMLPSWKTDTDGLAMFYECRSSELHIEHYFPMLGRGENRGNGVSL